MTQEDLEAPTAPNVSPPTTQDWGDPDEMEFMQREAYETYFGKTREEATAAIAENSYNAEELQDLPERVFRYYVLAYCDYLASPQSELDYVAASMFSTVLGTCLPMHNLPTDEETYLLKFLDYVVGRQEFYGIDETR